MIRTALRLSVTGLCLGLGCNGLAPYYPEGRPPEADADADADTDTDSDTDVDTDSDTDTDPQILPLDVSSVEPAHGTDVGGTEVELIGGPFDASAQVYFGDAKAKVLGTGSTWVRAETPRYTEGGYAHVRVVTDTHQGQLDNGFLYWPDGTGQNGVLGSFSHYQYVGSYWTDGTPAPDAGASLFFTDPTSVEWWELYAPGFDQCRSNYDFGGSITVYEPEVTRFTLRRGTSTALNLFQGSGETPSYIFETSGNVAQDYSNNAVYDLESAGAGEWPEFTIGGVVATPASFSITSPVVNSSTVPYISRYSFNLRWTGSGGDYMLARLLRYSTSGSLLEEVTCVLNDTGSFTVPGSVWTSWSTDAQITIVLGRVVEPAGLVPFNQADSGMVGIQWIIGAGFTQ